MNDKKTLHSSAQHALAKKKLQSEAPSAPVPSSDEMLGKQEVQKPMQDPVSKTAQQAEAENQLVKQPDPVPVEKTSNEALSKEQLKEQLNKEAQENQHAEQGSDLENAFNHLNKCREKALEHVGEKGCNPFLWVNENVTPIRQWLVNDRNKSQAIAAALALKVPEKPNSSRGINHVQIPSSPLEVAAKQQQGR